MIHECTIDHGLNRLSAHFGARVRIRPPATAASLAELEKTVGPLPRDLTIFLSTCDGLRVDVAGSSPGFHLWHVEEILAAIRSGKASPSGGNLVPVRGELGGERDWLIFENGPARGAVVRCDPWAPGAELVGSSFGCYLGNWISFLIANFDPDGQPRKGVDPVTFDAAFASALDEELLKMVDRQEVKQWLRQLDRAVSSGADFE